MAKGLDIQFKDTEKGLYVIDTGRKGPLLVTERPIHHPQQVRSPDELVVGQTYRVYGKGGPGPLLKILEKEIPDEPGSIRVAHLNPDGSEILNSGGSETFTETRCLTDMGVAPYDGGKWNPSNYVVPEQIRGSSE